MNSSTEKMKMVKLLKWGKKLQVFHKYCLSVFDNVDNFYMKIMKYFQYTYD